MYCSWTHLVTKSRVVRDVVILAFCAYRVMVVTYIPEKKKT